MLHLIGLLLTLNYDARNHELKKNTYPILYTHDVSKATVFFLI